LSISAKIVPPGVKNVRNPERIFFPCSAQFYLENPALFISQTRPSVYLAYKEKRTRNARCDMSARQLTANAGVLTAFAPARA